MFELTGTWNPSVAADVRVQQLGTNDEIPGDVRGRIVGGVLRDADGNPALELPEGPNIFYRVRFVNLKVSGVTVEPESVVIKAGAADEVTDLSQRLPHLAVLGASAGGGEPGSVAAADITDSTTVGRAVLTAADGAAARAAIGAGTSNVTVGTGAGNAKPGNYQPTAAQISDASAVGRSVLTATDAAAARTAIGAGTSSLALGASASQAAAGNHAHNAGQITATAVEGGTATTVQGILAELAARIAAVETP
ncbi:hypothetical protein ACFV6Y_39180 [Streptomyces massasporeus]|uniref:hypothetical protein n=1 Tax=Streptomyces massasporeus TaxID=67324 RepID=UPI0036651E9D